MALASTSWKPALQSLAAILAVYACYHIGQLVYLNLWRRSFKQRHGCAEPSKYPHTDRWGSDLIKARTTALKEGRYLDLYGAQFRQFGRTFMESTRGEIAFNTSDPVNLKHVLVSDYASFGKPSGSRRYALPFLGNSVLNDGPHHRRIKALIKPVFQNTIDEMDGRGLARLKVFADRFMDLLPDKKQRFDIQPLCKRLFLDYTTDFIFGSSIDSLEDETNGQTFVKAMSTAARWVGIRREAGWMAFRCSWNKEYLEACKTVHRFIDAQVARALQRTGTEDTKQYAILDELAKHIRDPVELRSQTLGIFLPGSSSPAALLENVLFILARHPDQWKGLRRSIPTINDRDQLTFKRLQSSDFDELRWVVSETLRHLGPQGPPQRTAKRDTYLPRGGGPTQDRPVFVPKDSRVYLGLNALHHDPEIWGDDADKFRPQRWMHRRPADYEWLPFATGPRVCPAANQAIVQTVYLLFRLLQRYEGVENHDPEEKYVELWTMAYESRNGVKIAFT